MTTDDPDRLLTRKEVAALFKVTPATVTCWAKDGHLSVVRTLGGHRRYREAEIRTLLGEGGDPSCVT